MAQYSKTPVLEAIFTNGTQEFYIKSITKTDASGNVYTGGATLNGMGNYDLLLVKNSPTGATLWTKQYAGLGNGDDALVNFVVDASLNVFVVGTVYTSATNKNDILTIKYNSAGVQQWLQTYNAPANGFDVGGDIVIGNNNIYITGGVQTSNGLSDFATIKYNSAGVFQWVRTYDSVGLYDGAQKITYVANGIGEITVAGGAQQALTTWKYAARKYDANGTVLNTTVSGGSASGVDEVHDLTKDAAGNIYLTGSIVNVGTGNDMYTVKLNAADLSIAWTAIYNSSGSQTDKSNSVTVDASNNVYITGYSQHPTEGKNYTTIKYNSSGVQQWIQTYNGEANGDDEGAALLFDNNFVYVTGTSKINGNKDYYTICYTASGTKSWAIGYNGSNNKDDIATAIAIDNAKSIIVAGQSNLAPTNNTYTTVKYLQKDLYNPKPTIAAKGKAGYLENRGQILNTNLTPNTTIKYYCDQSYPATYIDDSKISYLFSSLDTTEMDSLHRVDMQFNKGNGSAKVYPNDLRKTYYNYYLGYMTKNGERTLGYNSIVKYGVYTNTDVIYTQNSKGYRHYIVARSGAPTASFEMQYTGQTSLTVDALGNLKVATTLGTLKQPKAKAYTMNNTTGVLTLLSWQPAYVVTGGNKVSFTYGTWPAGSTLVIEIEKSNQLLNDYLPVANLGWSTYVGGAGYDVYNSVTTDIQGFQYTVGSSSSQFFAISTVPFQGVNLASTSAVWNKFDPGHGLDYGTYYGGSTTGYTYGLDIDVVLPSATTEYGVYIVGTTEDADLIIKPVTGADNDDTPGGSFADGFIARFNILGELTWSRYYGGGGNDKILSIDHGVAQDIYFTGQTFNAGSNFPLVDPGGGAYYQSTSAGEWDGFIGKIDSDLQLTWSTLYGGSDSDSPNELVFDREQNSFYIAGYTSSSNLPIGPTYLDNTLNGLTDAFIVKFANNGNSLWGTFLGGNGADGNLNGRIPDISLSFKDKLYFTAQTQSDNLAAAYSTVTWADNSFNGLPCPDAFIMVIDVLTLQPLWASYFGEAGCEYITGIAHDKNNGFFITGITGANNYSLLNDFGNYYQQNYQEDDCANNDEAFIVHYDNNYQKNWLTYFGGINSCDVDNFNQDSPDQPQDINFYTNGFNSYLYLAGKCGDYTISTEAENFPMVDFDGILDVAYFDPSYNSDNFDAFISMFTVTQVTTNLNDNLTKTNPIKLYPSPANNEITLVLETTHSENIQVEIYNLLGQRVELVKNLVIGKNIINIKALAPGKYTVLVKDDGLLTSTGGFIKE